MSEALENTYRYKYDSFYDYKACYDEEYFANLGSTYADLRPTDVFVDMGCGKGRTIAILPSYCKVSKRLAVDEDRESLEKLSQMDGVAAFNMAAEEFSQLDIEYSKVLFQETAHLLPRDTLETVMKNIYAKLPNGGRVIVDQMSSTDAFHLFSSAQERWKTKMARDAYEPVMKGCGYLVEVFRKVFQVEIPKDNYVSMLRRRLLCVLKEVDDKELEEGINSMSFDDPVKYEEVHYFIVGEKVAPVESYE
jgi:precorrin-6B methylase 2